jgi:hypothetical protein
MKEETATQKKIVLKISDWQANVLDYLQSKTDMTYTQICRGALNDYLHQVLADFTYDTFGTAQSRVAKADFEFSTLISMERYAVKDLFYAWRDWKTWDEELKEMTKSNANAFKRLAWELLRLLKQNTGHIILRDVTNSLNIEYPEEIAPRLLIFFRQQDALFDHMDIIPENDLEQENKNETYYDMKWREYGTILEKKIEDYKRTKTEEISKLTPISLEQAYYKHTSE